MGETSLQRGDKGEDVLALQTELNKVGAMLSADSDFGPATEQGVRYAQEIAGLPVTGVADAVLQNWLVGQAQPSTQLHTNGVAFTAKEETGGHYYYQLVTRWPHYPGSASGITIGVGYDLRFNTRDDFLEHWGPCLPESLIEALLPDIGRKGAKARADELKSQGLMIPFSAAWQVFTRATLPRFYQTTESVYPSLSRLPDYCRSVLVSLVFNRGASTSGERRKEMLEIQKLLEYADGAGLDNWQKHTILQGVEDLLLAMKRLWAPGSGLLARRQAEANLWRTGLSLWLA